MALMKFIGIKVAFEINVVSMPVIFFVLYYLFIFILAIYFKLKNVVSKIQSGKGEK